MKLNEFANIKVGDSFLAHDQKATLKSYFYQANLVGHFDKDGESRPIYSHDTIVEYIRGSGEVVVLVSQHPKPDKLELPEYQSV